MTSLKAQSATAWFDRWMVGSAGWTLRLVAMLVLALVTGLCGLQAQPPIASPLARRAAASVSVDAPSPVEVFEAAWQLIRRHFYDSDLNGLDWDAVRRHYRPRFARVETEGQMRALFSALFRELDASHLSWVDRSVYESMRAELANRRVLTFGVVLEETSKQRLFVRALYEGGPGERAGLQVGDEIVAIEGDDPFSHSALVPAADDPCSDLAPLFLLDHEHDSELAVLVKSRPRDRGRILSLRAIPMNGVDAARHSVRVLEVGGRRLGLVHLWFCQRGVDEVLKDALRGPLKNCDGLVLDIRGRGGFADLVPSILKCFPARAGRDARRVLWNKPLVVLIDERTRSAKEMLAWRVRDTGIGTLIGRHTEGAVLGAGFFELPDGSYLELPVQAVPVARGIDLEGVGVEPDIEVESSLPYSHGRDPILERGLEHLLERLGRRATVSGPY